MPRTRLRPSYIRKNYTYHCTLLGPPPQILWDTARAMQALWNTLVTLHDALSIGWDLDTPKASKTTAYDTFWREAYLVVRDEGERLGLPCWPKWHVFDTFKAAQQRFARHQGGPPHAHHGLRQIFIPHRTDSGGVPIAWLWRDTPAKHTAILPRTPGHHHQEGYLSIGDTRIPLHVLLHRPLPEEAILKRVALIGRFEPALRRSVSTSNVGNEYLARAVPATDAGNEKKQCAVPLPDRGNKGSISHTSVLATDAGNIHGHSVPLPDRGNKGSIPHTSVPATAAGNIIHLSDGWQWSFQCSIEMPPPVPLPATGRVAGLDVGWRVREDGLRLAVLTDGTSTWEWRLPFDLANAALRRRQRLYASHHASLETTGNWRVLWHLQATLDTHLDACKAALDASDRTAWPADATALWGQHAKVRAEGLRRLRRLLANAGLPCSVLEVWQARHQELARRIRGAQLHIQRAKTHLYRHFADWLARHYDVVAWEDDLDLKQLAEATTGLPPALDAARKYRQMAGLSVLRGYIREAMAKAGRIIQEEAAAYTTQTCAQCGAPIVPSAALVLTCAAGHVQDTDVNAAMVLWQAITPRQEAAEVPPPRIDREQLRRGLSRLAYVPRVHANDG